MFGVRKLPGFAGPDRRGRLSLRARISPNTLTVRSVGSGHEDGFFAFIHAASRDFGSLALQVTFLAAYIML
jgi:hypothetical protein